MTRSPSDAGTAAAHGAGARARARPPEQGQAPRAGQSRGEADGERRRGQGIAPTPTRGDPTCARARAGEGAQHVPRAAAWTAARRLTGRRAAPRARGAAVAAAAGWPAGGRAAAQVNLGRSPRPRRAAAPLSPRRRSRAGAGSGLLRVAGRVVFVVFAALWVVWRAELVGVAWPHLSGMPRTLGSTPGLLTGNPAVGSFPAGGVCASWRHCGARGGWEGAGALLGSRGRRGAEASVLGIRSLLPALEFSAGQRADGRLALVP